MRSTSRSRGRPTRRGTLANGATISLASTSQAVQIEQVLGALSLLLNGGGIGQLHDIVVELNHAAGGRGAEIHSLLSDADRVIAAIDAHRAGIIAALQQVNRLATTLQANNDNISIALRDLPAGLKVLAGQRHQLVRMINALGRLGRTATTTVRASKRSFVADLRALDPILSHLVQAGSALPKSLQVLLTYPFPDSVLNAIRGDYLNTFVTTNLNTPGGKVVRDPEEPDPASGAGGALMLTHRVRIQVIVFIVAGLLAVSYIAVRYVGLLRVFNVGVYGVRVELAAAGGLFPNAEVDYRGVPVGRVTSVGLTATGVEAQLQLNSSAASIPQNVRAVVTDRSIIGEQYLDLRPTTAAGPVPARRLGDRAEPDRDPADDQLAAGQRRRLAEVAADRVAADRRHRVRQGVHRFGAEPAHAHPGQPDVLPRGRPELPGHVRPDQLVRDRAAHATAGVIEHQVVQQQPEPAVQSACCVRTATSARC